MTPIIDYMTVLLEYPELLIGDQQGTTNNPCMLLCISTSTIYIPHVVHQNCANF